MRVPASITEVDLEGDYADTVDGVEAECSRCSNTAEAYGTDERSITRCLVTLRETCPRGENNYYSDR